MRRKAVVQALEQEQMARERVDQLVVQQAVRLNEANAKLEETRKQYKAFQRQAKARIRKLERQKFRVFKIAAQHINELEEKTREQQPAGVAVQTSGNGSNGTPEANGDGLMPPTKRRRAKATPA